jgi:hypothetical protein
MLRRSQVAEGYIKFGCQLNALSRDGESVVSLTVNGVQMAFPTKTCVVCTAEFELKPDKPGFANRCPECSAPEATVPTSQRPMDADERKSLSEANEARRQAMRQLLYRKDS